MGINRGINPWSSSLPSPELVPQYRGEWAAVPYQVADVVRYGYGLYIAHSNTSPTDIPGLSTVWAGVVDGSELKTLVDAAKNQNLDLTAALNTADALMDVLRKTNDDTSNAIINTLQGIGNTTVVNTEVEKNALTPTVGQRVYVIETKAHYSYNGTAWQQIGTPIIDQNKFSSLISSLSNTVAGLGTKGQADGVQFADGSRWVWATGTEDGGTKINASDGGVWKREQIEHYNVKWFGATGRGDVSDTAAINRAIQAAKITGGVVYFPKGTYLIDGAGISIEGVNGLTLVGESRFSTSLLNGMDNNHMIVINNSQMIGIENMEMYQSGQKSFGAYVKVTDSHIFHASRIRMQNPVQGFVFDGVGGMHLYDIKFVPQNVDWNWSSAIYIQKSAGFFGSNIDVNFGRNIVLDAAVVLEGGCDTIYFLNSGFNQIGTTFGDGKGGNSLHLTNRVNSSSTPAFNPRWIRFVNCAFEAGNGAAVLAEAGNNVEFNNCYAVTNKNAIMITSPAVTGFKWSNGVIANNSEHCVQIVAGQDITITGATITGGSLSQPNTYSGVSISPAAINVTISDCIIGDTTTLEGGVTTKMAYGIIVEIDTNMLGNAVTVKNNTYGPLCTTPVYNGSVVGQVIQQKRLEGIQPPSIGTWRPGDYVLNTNPVIQTDTTNNSSYIIKGWVYISPTVGWVQEKITVL